MSEIMDMLGPLMDGLGQTLTLFALTLVFSMPLGFIICFGRMSKIAPVRWISQLYIFVLRGTPLVLQIIFVFFGLPLLGIQIDRMPAAVVAFSLNYAAYFAEIYRSGIQAIPHGQYEAADVLGLSRSQTFFKVILKQVIKTVLPPVGNEIIVLVKDTALVYVIAISDLLRTAQVMMMNKGNIVPLLVAGVFYLILTSIFTVILNIIEKKLSYYRI